MRKELPKLLGKYKGSDFITRERTRFIYYLCIAVIITISLQVTFRLITHPLTNLDDSTHISVLLPLMILLVLIIGCFCLLINGFYNLSSHIIPVILMITTWAIMLLEKGSLLARTDTVVNIFIAFSIISFLTGRSKLLILTYSLVNILLVFVFAFYIKDEYGLIQTEISDYIIDVSVAIAFMGFVGYNIYSINKNALESAESDFKRRIEVEKEFSQSKRQYQELTELLPVAIYESNRNGRIIYINQAGFKIFGYSEEDYKDGIYISSMLVDKDIIASNMLQIKQGEPSGHQNTAIKKNGEKFPVQIYSSEIEDEGKFIGQRGVIIDISERVKADEDLRQSEDRFRSIMEQSSFSMEVLAPDGSLQYINDANKKLWGVNYDPSVLLNYNILKDLQLLELGLMPIIEKAFTGERVHLPAAEYDLSMTLGPGLHKIVEGDFYPVRNNDGSLRYIIVIHQDISERVRAEEALRASERKFREMTFLLPQAVYELDASGNITFINRAGITMFGYTDEDTIQGINVFNIIVNEDHERVRESIKKLLNGEITPGNQYMGLRRDGSTFPMQIYSSLIVENNKTTGFRGVVIDLTKIKEVENELRQSNELFKTLIESTPIPTTLIDMDRRFLMVNKAFCNDVGLKPEDVLGKTIEDIGITSEGGKEEIINKILEEKGSVENFELSTFSKNVKKHELYVYATLVTINNKKVILRSNINVTDKKKLENKLRESENLFRTIVNMIPYWITISNNENKYTYANRAFLDKFHLDLNEIKGKTLDELGFRLDENSNQQLEKEYREKGSIFNLEVTATSPEQEKFCVLLSSQPVMIDDKPHIIKTTVDITYHKMLEEQLKVYNLKLEELVNERTEDLAAANEELHATNEELFAQREQLEETLTKLKETQEQLIQTEKMSTLGILTAGVAHEINNPVNYIYNGVAVIDAYIKEKYQSDYEFLKPFFEAVNIGIDRTTSIVKMLNKYSRKETTVFSKCNIHLIIDNCLLMLHNSYKNRIDIKKRYFEGMPEIMVNEGKLYQAFFNILTNAVQAIADIGEIVITTALTENNVEIRFFDNGKGINEEDMKHIFDPFFTTKGPGQGTGLGLSIAQRLIQEHGGKIVCKSQLNINTEFIINIPINQ